MAETTRPTGEQLRFISERTGEHIVDIYLEAAERGNRTLADLMADIFDESGQRRSIGLELRVNATTRQFQYRDGGFIDPEAGWVNVPAGFIFRQRGAYASGQAYEQLDVVTQNDSVYVCTVAHTSATPNPGVNFTLLINGEAVNMARAQAETSAAAAISSATSANTSATNAATSAASANTSATNASASATAAATSAANAAASATAAGTSASTASSAASTSTTNATNAASSASNASSSASAAATSATLAQNFANAGVNVQVQPGLFSAYHWSEQARIFATGTLTYRGTWSAAGGTYPTSPANNDFYIISVAGTLGGTAHVPGDQIIYRAAIPGWERVATGQTVFSVAGKTGAVTLVIADIANLQTTLNNKTDVGHTHTIANVTGLQTALDGKAATAHTHVIADVTGLQAQLDGKAASSHTHTIAQVTNLQTSLDAKLDASAYTATDVRTKLLAVDGAGSGLDADLLDGQDGSFYRNYANLTGVPSTFAPSAHTHTIAEVTGLQAALDGKQATIGFTPVEQGGGTGQGTNKIRIGWSSAASRLKVQVDSTDLGNVVFDTQLTWNNVSGKPSTFTPSAHTHVISEVTGLQSALDAKQNTLGFTPVQQSGGTTIALGWSGSRLTATQAGTSLGNIVFDTNLTWSAISGRPTEFTPTAHTHAASDITSGVFTVGLIPNLDASKIITGVFDPARLGGGTINQGMSLTIGALGAREWRFLTAGDIVSGTLPVARGGTGVTSSTGSGNNVLSDSPTFSGTVTVGGSITASGDITAFSDRRLKRLEGNFELSLDEIAGVRPINYRMAEGGDRSTGVFAQELQDILPRLVINNPHPDYEGGLLSVDYAKAGTVLALCLAQHVKEQAATIKALHARILELEMRVK